MNLYQEEILDHFKNPRNKKLVDNATVSVEKANPLCGDKLGMELNITDGVVKEVGFWGEGCAISQASMSMLTEVVAGKRVKELKNIDKEFILDMLGVDVGPARLKCALLSLEVLKEAVRQLEG